MGRWLWRLEDGGEECGQLVVEGPVAVRIVASRGRRPRGGGGCCLSGAGERELEMAGASSVALLAMATTNQQVMYAVAAPQQAVQYEYYTPQASYAAPPLQSAPQQQQQQYGGAPQQAPAATATAVSSAAAYDQPADAGAKRPAEEGRQSLYYFRSHLNSCLGLKFLSSFLRLLLRRRRLKLIDLSLLIVS